MLQVGLIFASGCIGGNKAGMICLCVCVSAFKISCLTSVLLYSLMAWFFVNFGWLRQNLSWRKTMMQDWVLFIFSRKYSPPKQEVQGPEIIVFVMLELQQLLDVAGLVPRNSGFRAGEAVTVWDELTFVGLSVGFVSLPFSAALWKHHGLKVDVACSKRSFLMITLVLLISS